MFFADKSELTRLPFTSRSPFFASAQVEWKGYILNPTANNQDKSIIDLSHESLNKLFWNIYGPLSFIELCELYSSLAAFPELNKSTDWSTYLGQQNSRFDQRFIELSQAVAKTSADFRNWCYQKKASSQDIRPIKSLKDYTSFNKLGSFFSQLNLTRNEGREALDLLVDLLLMENEVSKLFPTKNQNWTEQLKKLRFPLSYKEQQQPESNPWPQYVLAQKQRQGDRIVEKIQITYSGEKDLRDKLKRLSQIQGQGH